MKLAELKEKIIDMLGEFYDVGSEFRNDINECDNGFDILAVLNDYGYDMQGGLDIMFDALIEQD